MSNSIPQLTEYQVYVLTVAAKNDRKYIIMEGPSPGDDAEVRGKGDKNMKEVDDLVSIGWLFYADPEVFADVRAESAAKGCTCAGYLVPDFAKKMFRNIDQSSNPN